MGATKTLITTPIFYVNAVPHIGHLYSTVLADALSRWCRIKGSSTWLTTGTDEHGLKVQQAAVAAEQTPLAFCSKISSRFQSLFDSGHIQYDDYLRTTEPRHMKTVQSLWTTLADRDWIYLGLHEAWYCRSDEAFLTESQVETNPMGVKVSKESGHPVERLVEENYKFRLSAFQTRLEAWLDANPEVIVPATRHAEVKQMVQDGLNDLSISRLHHKIPWGIPVPTDPSHTIYVWLDALANYRTTCSHPSNVGQEVWPPDYQIIGKDILKFHAIYWPAFLMAANLPLPQRIVAHGHWTVDGVKMSKSLGNVVDPVEALNKYRVDPVRYFLLREGQLGYDSNFSFALLEERCNAELSDTLGNLGKSRITVAFEARVLTNRHCSFTFNGKAIQSRLLRRHPRAAFWG